MFFQIPSNTVFLNIGDFLPCGDSGTQASSWLWFHRSFGLVAVCGSGEIARGRTAGYLKSLLPGSTSPFCSCSVGQNSVLSAHLIPGKGEQCGLAKGPGRRGNRFRGPVSIPATETLQVKFASARSARHIGLAAVFPLASTVLAEVLKLWQTPEGQEIPCKYLAFGLLLENWTFRQCLSHILACRSRLELCYGCPSAEARGPLVRHGSGHTLSSPRRPSLSFHLPSSTRPASRIPAWLQDW